MKYLGPISDPKDISTKGYVDEEISSHNHDDRYYKKINIDEWFGNKANITPDGVVLSPNADYAEIMEWKDQNTSAENRVGYFVSIDTLTSGNTIVKSTSSSDVFGVVMESPGFAAGASNERYSEGVLLSKYCYVGFAGFIPVIDNGTCTVNGRCMPDNNGCAIPSTNNLGYHVIDRIDATHITILVEPNIDMVQRIKVDMQYKSPINNPAFTGTPTAPTAPAGADNNQIATTEFVKNALESTGSISRATVSILSNNTSSIDIPINITDVNSLTVYHNGLILTPTIHYTATTSTITLVGYTAKAGDIFTFVGSTVSGTSLNPVASNVLFSDTNYEGCTNVQDALVHIAEDLAPVATSGSYNDLTDKPTIPTIPTNVSSFTNDAHYLTSHQDISGKLNKSGGTMTGALVAQNNTNYTTKQVRNVILSTEEPTSSDGANGDVWIVYEA